MIKRSLKRSSLLTLTLMMALSLSACGDDGSEPADRTDVETLTAETVDIGIEADTKESLKEAAGVTVHGQRFVLQYDDPASQIAPEGATSYYVSYEFEDGVMDGGTSMVWYGFGSKAAYREALNGYVLQNTDYFLKHYNDEALYYAYYVLPTVQDQNGDGELSWDEVMYDFEKYEKENARLIR